MKYNQRGHLAFNVFTHCRLRMTINNGLTNTVRKSSKRGRYKTHRITLYAT